MLLGLLPAIFSTIAAATGEQAQLKAQLQSGTCASRQSNRAARSILDLFT